MNYNLLILTGTFFACHSDYFSIIPPKIFNRFIHHLNILYWSIGRQITSGFCLSIRASTRSRSVILDFFPPIISSPWIHWTKIIFHVRSQSSCKTEPVRVESTEPIFGASRTLWRCQSRSCSRCAKLWRFPKFPSPHLHVLATDGCFFNDGAFMICPPPKTAELEELFRHEVVKNRDR